jgi:hypothetical protein
MHPQPGVRIVVVNMHTSIHSGGTGNIRHSPRDGLTAYGVLPGDEFVLPPSSSWHLGLLVEPVIGRRSGHANDVGRDPVNVKTFLTMTRALLGKLGAKGAISWKAWKKQFANAPINFGWPMVGPKATLTTIG